MIKTKIKKVIAVVGIATLSIATIGSTFAATIGTASITNGISTDIIWDDTFPGTATGSSNVTVSAQVLPTLNMIISTGSINLGILLADIEKTGNLDIEIGTNAANGVTITAKSGSGGLTNTSDNTLQINNLIADGIAESYNFSSTFGAIDSTVSNFANTNNLLTTPVNNSTEHIIYSTNKPEQNDGTNADVTFTVATTANAQTAAGNYQDTITFTVTGNF